MFLLPYYIPKIPDVTEDFNCVIICVGFWITEFGVKFVENATGGRQLTVTIISGVKEIAGIAGIANLTNPAKAENKLGIGGKEGIPGKAGSPKHLTVEEFEYACNAAKTGNSGRFGCGVSGTPGIRGNGRELIDPIPIFMVKFLHMKLQIIHQNLW